MEEKQRRQIVWLQVKDIHPYKNNPRKIGKDAVDAVAASIKEFGFRSPIILDKDNTIINGHTRLKAAKKLGLTHVPCIIADDLTEEQVKKFRLIDNKSAEFSEWDADLLAEELFDTDLALDFDFDFSEDLKKKKKWAGQKVKCNLKDCLGLHRCEDMIYHTIFKASKEGVTLEEIKTEKNVKMFAITAADIIASTLGPNISENDWCIVTTPARRHKDFHFATEVCKMISEALDIPFYDNVFICESNQRIDPEFEMQMDPDEKNVIIYDDIITTGSTMKAVKALLIDTGHTVFPIVSINNH